MAGGESGRDIAAIVHEVRRQLGPDPTRWLEGALEEARLGFERPRFLAAYAGAARRLRTRTPGAAPELIARARGALLETALAALPDDAHVPLVRELFRRGDSDERIAVLRSLSGLPAPARFVPIAIEACRTHVQVVFESIACDNPYAARHFPEEAFQQLVLKALFIGVPLARVEGLETRRSAELARMAADYASELRAAGRVVSRDVERLASGAPAAEAGGR
jgi:hypothetical protein